MLSIARHSSVKVKRSLVGFFSGMIFLAFWNLLCEKIQIEEDDDATSAQQS